MVLNLKEIAPKLKTGLLYMEGLYQPSLYARTTRADALHPYFHAVNEELIREAHLEGLLVNTFTVNDPYSTAKSNAYASIAKNEDKIRAKLSN